MYKTEIVMQILTKELDTLNDKELYDLFMFFHNVHNSITSIEKYNKFISSFEKNPFRPNSDKDFKKQMIENLKAYTTDYMSLITAIDLIKNKFTVDEITDNYYSHLSAFDNNLF